jgi:DNA primase
MSAPTNGLLERLDRVHQTGAKKWMACCPAHDDRNPSLSVSEGRDGRVLVHCFAGCSVDEVLRALQLTLRDLYPAKISRAL